MNRKLIEHYITDDTLVGFSNFLCTEELDAVYWEHVNTIDDSSLGPAWKEKLKKLFHRIKSMTEEMKFHVFCESQKKTAKKMGLKKSDTVGEWINRLVELGIVTKVPTKRGNNYQSVNIIVINPIIHNEPEQEAKQLEKMEKGDLETIKNGEQHISFYSYLHFNNIYITKYVEDSLLQKLNQENIIPPSIPEEFFKAVRPYFNGEMILTLWDRVKKAAKSCRLKGEYVDVAVDALKTSLSFYKYNELKKGQTIDSMIGFFYGRVKYLLEQKVNDYNAMWSKQNPISSNHPLRYNWLED